MAFADGYAAFAKPYTHEQLERYLEPIVPAWDGAHILRLWFRCRDQHVFWPWNVQTAETRSDADVPNLDFLHRGVVELVEAGDVYRCGSPRTEWIDSRGRGRIYSFSVTRRVTEPYAIAYVTLDEGVSMLTNLVDCDFERLKIGAPVRVVFRSAADGEAIPMFTPT